MYTVIVNLVTYVLFMCSCLFVFAEIIEDVAESPAPPAPISMVSPSTAEQGAYRKLELTKQVLAAHTQKEEQAFLSRCKELCLSWTLQKDCPPYRSRNRGQALDGKARRHTHNQREVSCMLKALCKNCRTSIN